MTDEQPKSKPIELSQMVYVRGGTTSSAHDNRKAQEFADAERRRNEQLDQMKAARTGVLPEHLKGEGMEAGAQGMGKMSSMKLGGSKAGYASIVLSIKHPKDEKTLDWIVCELLTQPDKNGQPELLLNLCCPRCVLKRGVKMGDAQMKLAQSNRMFWLDEKRKGELWVNPNDPNEMVTIAGTVTTNDWCSCPQCDLQFKIDDSVLHVR